jgi:hypothetical protein
MRHRRHKSRRMSAHPGYVDQLARSEHALSNGRQWFAAQCVMDASSAWKHTPTGELDVKASKSRVDDPGATGV